MAEEKKEKFESSYPKGVRIAAIIGVIFLVALYIVTLIAGITTSKAAPELFKMCIGSSILLPILFWLYIQFTAFLLSFLVSDFFTFFCQISTDSFCFIIFFLAGIRYTGICWVVVDATFHFDGLCFAERTRFLCASLYDFNGIAG